MRDMYRIICLKRTEFRNSLTYDFKKQWYNDSHVVYWKPNFQGYTYDIDEAGIYHLKDLIGLNGRFMDWLLEPAWE